MTKRNQSQKTHVMDPDEVFQRFDTGLLGYLGFFKVHILLRISILPAVTDQVPRRHLSRSNISMTR